jgi:predicted Fe-S protein YdhL (DUF1289 family)
MTSSGPFTRPPSPCIGICNIEPLSGWCQGCRRSLTEIANWSAATAEQQWRIVAELPTRRFPSELPR